MAGKKAVAEKSDNIIIERLKNPDNWKRALTRSGGVGAGYLGGMAAAKAIKEKVEDPKFKKIVGPGMILGGLLMDVLSDGSNDIVDPKAEKKENSVFLPAIGSGLISAGLHHSGADFLPDTVSMPLGLSGPSVPVGETSEIIQDLMNGGWSEAEVLELLDTDDLSGSIESSGIDSNGIEFEDEEAGELDEEYEDFEDEEF